MLPQLQETISQVQKRTVPEDRKESLKPLIDYIEACIKNSEDIKLNFICTHNSRRSQFAQIWAQTAGAYHNIPVSCYSGGMEVTAFNERAVASIKRSGFRVTAKGTKNPTYFIFFSDDHDPISTFSKKFDDPVNTIEGFAAIMTCAHADETCPFIPNASVRISLHYEDPKAYDDKPEEAEKYDERSMQIASEMFYVFSQLTSHVE